MKAIGLRWMLVTMLGFVLLAPGITVGDGSQMETEGGSTGTLNATPVAPAMQPPTSSSQPLNWLKSLSGEPITSLSDGELIALIGRSIESDKRYLETLTEELESEDNPFTRASEFFERLDQEMVSLRSALAEAEQTDQQEPKESVEAEISELETVHSLAKERFDLAIERRRLMVQMVPLIEMRLAQSQIMMGNALGETDPGVAVEPMDPINRRDEETQEDVPTAEPPSDPSAVDSPPGTAPQSTEVPEAPLASRSKKRPPSEEYVLATAEVQQWEQTLAEVHKSLRIIEARLEIGDRALKLERSMAENGRQMLDNSEALRVFFSEQFQQRSLDGLSAAELEPIRQMLQETIQLSKIALERSRTATDRVASITAARTHLLEALATRKMDAHLAETELEHARTQMARIQNPFHPRNLFRWFLDHGPGLLAILLGMTILYFAVQVVGSRVVRVVANRGCRGSKAERMSRANTLVYTFRQAGSLAVLVGGVLMILEEVGIPIGPLLGGAAVFGLAIAFGAQNLIKDFFQGFMILLENQYKLNDVVQIGDHAGLVEQITLRTTALRSLDGTLHFIPNGQIEAVSNLTHGWSRALFDIPVAYREDADRVMEVITKVCREVREDPNFRHLCLEDVTMLGVDDFADSAVIIKFFIKTIPLQQWAVRREVLRRIKMRFDAENIEIPFPHHTHYLRSADGGPLEAAFIDALAGGKPLQR
jgi:moderate conductance mechanosensitive channel